ncbi:IclR family transcriptional regulator [Leifsonia poae]|uniref:IclR family transcriptional regulator n=1 Tax=Leifsonia poae TaxID=110933 RepID=UPI003D66A1CD
MSTVPEAQPPLQTLARGIRMLEVLAESGEPMTIAGIASQLELHRSIVYRLLRTLEEYSLVVRDPSGAVRLGPRMATLARSVSRDLQSAALPQLTAIANELAMTAFLAVLDRHDVVTLVSVAPANAHVTVAQKPGTRHPLAFGAPGIAIQSVLSEAQWGALPDEHPRHEAADARTRGYATSHDEVIPGLASVAVPVAAPNQPVSALAVVYVADGRDVEAIGARLRESAAAISDALH